MRYDVDTDHFKTLRSEELRLIHSIYMEICRQPWFNCAQKQKLANYIVAMYQRGMVDQTKLKQLCTAAAREDFARRENEVGRMVNTGSNRCE